MTGQLSLKGKILNVSDCKEKVLVAKREKINEIIVPKANKHDLDDMSNDIREGMTFHFVEDYEEVFKIAFES